MRDLIEVERLDHTVGDKVHLPAEGACRLDPVDRVRGAAGEADRLAAGEGRPRRGRGDGGRRRAAADKDGARRVPGLGAVAYRQRDGIGYAVGDPQGAPVERCLDVDVLTFCGGLFGFARRCRPTGERFVDRSGSLRTLGD